MKNMDALDEMEKIGQNCHYRQNWTKLNKMGKNGQNETKLSKITNGKNDT